MCKFDLNMTSRGSRNKRLGSVITLDVSHVAGLKVELACGHCLLRRIGTHRILQILVSKDYLRLVARML